MRLGIRLLFGFFLITGLAAFFVMRVFVSEVKPSVRQVMEDIMVDTANILAELATEDLVSGQISNGRFAEHVNQYASRTVDARIWGHTKKTLDFRVYVTDVTGKVLFDSIQQADGQDYSQWRDVALTLRGQYGARSTRDVEEDQLSTVMYVAAPISFEGKVIGVLTVAKPNSKVQAFIDRAERKILVSGFWLLALSALVGVVVTVWVVWSIRQLRRYANDVEAGKKVAVPRVAGELGELARAMDAMRQRVERREYMEAYVRALTHELKSPLAAIRGAGELLQDDLPAADREAFSQEVLNQTERLQHLVDRMLELSKLEQRQTPMAPERVELQAFLTHFAAHATQQRNTKAVQLVVDADHSVVLAETGLLQLALGNLVDNAAAFAPAGSTVLLHARNGVISVQDQGPGVPDFALPKMGMRFFSTVRPDGVTKGTGLGLAIVRQIMLLHGGAMQVHNTQPGLRVELIFPTSR
jgi:two-component system, OmpR family, sensor histidine kinase CreC